MKAVTYLMDVNKKDPFNSIYIENRDPFDIGESNRKWIILKGKGGTCYNTYGEWEFEPMPSNRDDDFLKRCRYTFDEAVEIASKLT